MKTMEWKEHLPGTDQAVEMKEGEDGRLICRILGEVDHHHAARIRLLIDGEVTRLHPPLLVLDLSRVDFMDSAGLGLILGRYNRVREYGGKLLLSDPSEQIMKILTLSGAERMIPITRSGERKGEKQ